MFERFLIGVDQWKNGATTLNIVEQREFGIPKGPQNSSPIISSFLCQDHQSCQPVIDKPWFII